MVNSFKRGFTLVELLIAASIFGIITTFVLLSYGRVSGQLFITTLAYEVALSFREAQNYGVSVKEFRSSDFRTFNTAYGLHFEDAPTRFVLFSDARRGSDGKGNRRYDGSNDASGCLSNFESECVSIFNLGRGSRIAKFCGVLPTDGGRDVADEMKREECNRDSTPPSNPSPSIAYLDVLFERPNPDGIVRTDRSGVGERYKAARVYLVSTTGDRRVVEVVNTGQISIK
ncbi:MAG: type II secretion system protein [bacterium]|nr:type II secretion system protein [bacterium]